VDVFKRHKTEVEGQLSKELQEARAQLASRPQHIVSHELGRGGARPTGTTPRGGKKVVPSLQGIGSVQSVASNKYT
jgi:hypothetical protein